MDRVGGEGRQRTLGQEECTGSWVSTIHFELGHWLCVAHGALHGSHQLPRRHHDGSCQAPQDDSKACF